MEKENGHSGHKVSSFYTKALLNPVCFLCQELLFVLMDFGKTNLLLATNIWLWKTKLRMGLTGRMWRLEVCSEVVCNFMGSRVSLCVGTDAN